MLRTAGLENHGRGGTASQVGEECEHRAGWASGLLCLSSAKEEGMHRCGREGNQLRERD